MQPLTPAVRPVENSERLLTVDAVRGFALLGILLMNIPTFALPGAAYSNPNVWGGNSPANVWTVILVYVLGEGKMRAIFSMMFGASVMLLTERGEKRGGGIETADIYFRRMLWLMLFGLLHAYLIWFGDILYPYALMGLCLFPLRKLSPRWLTLGGVGLILLMTAGSVADVLKKQRTLDAYYQVQALDLESTPLTQEQKDQQVAGLALRKEMYPDTKSLQEEIDKYRGSYLENFKARKKAVWRDHSQPFYNPFMWDIVSMMLLGMALYKTGVLTGEKSKSFYLRMAWIGGVTGLAINGAVMMAQLRHNFDPIAGMYDGLSYEIGRVPSALAYVALIVLAVKAGVAKWLTRRLAAVGQMAFSNYISHSIICSILFYGGYGFGLIGKLERWQLYVIVLGVWTFNLTWSTFWLRHFRFGPLEWVWRSLTYWKLQPLRLDPAPSLTQVPAPATLQ